MVSVVELFHFPKQPSSTGSFFPGTGAVTEIGRDNARGTTINVPFSGGAMTDTDYLLAWRLIALPALREFAADMIVVAAGFDACAGHTTALGGYELTPAIFGHFTQTLCEVYEHGKVVHFSTQSTLLKHSFRRSVWRAAMRSIH